MLTAMCRVLSMIG